MYTNGHTARDALAFIFSEHANFRVASELIYLDARKGAPEGTWAEHPEQRLISQSPGGRSLAHMIERSVMTDDEKRRVLKAATSKFLVTANRDFEIVMDDKMPRETFLRFELPIILRNEAIAEVNGIPREKLHALHAADPHPEKVTALSVIVDSLRERTLVPGPKPETETEKPHELTVLEREVDNLVSGRFRELAQQIKVAEGELNRAVLSWNAYVAEREAMGWEKLLPNVRLRLLTERWAKKKELRVRRRALDGLQKVQRKEEHALVAGRYSAHIESTLEHMGIRLDGLYGGKTKEVIAQAIERSVLKHKAEAERFDVSPKESRKPRMKPKL